MNAGEEGRYEDEGKVRVGVEVRVEAGSGGKLEVGRVTMGSG